MQSQDQTPLCQNESVSMWNWLKFLPRQPLRIWEFSSSAVVHLFSYGRRLLRLVCENISWSVWSRDSRYDEVLQRLKDVESAVSELREEYRQMSKEMGLQDGRKLRHIHVVPPMCSTPLPHHSIQQCEPSHPICIPPPPPPPPPMPSATTPLRSKKQQSSHDNSKTPASSIAVNIEAKPPLLTLNELMNVKLRSVDRRSENQQNKMPAADSVIPVVTLQDLNSVSLQPMKERPVHGTTKKTQSMNLPLSQLTSIKASLRKVNIARSPGGTPLEKKYQGDDGSLHAMMRRALAQRFLEMNSSLSSPSTSLNNSCELNQSFS